GPRREPLTAPIRRPGSLRCGASALLCVRVTSQTANELAVAADALTLNAASRSRRARGMTSAVAVGAQAREVHAASVVGSIIFLPSVILVAGKPLSSAGLRMMASSLAR